MTRQFTVAATRRAPCTHFVCAPAASKQTSAPASARLLPHALPPTCLTTGGGELTIADLIGGLGDSKSKLGAARKTLERLEKKTAPVSAPLPGPIRQRQERKAG